MRSPVQPSDLRPPPPLMLVQYSVTLSRAHSSSAPRQSGITSRPQCTTYHSCHEQSPMTASRACLLLLFRTACCGGLAEQLAICTMKRKRNWTIAVKWGRGCLSRMGTSLLLLCCDASHGPSACFGLRRILVELEAGPKGSLWPAVKQQTSRCP